MSQILITYIFIHIICALFTLYCCLKTKQRLSVGLVLAMVAVGPLPVLLAIYER